MKVKRILAALLATTMVLGNMSLALADKASADDTISQAEAEAFSLDGDSLLAKYALTEDLQDNSGNEYHASGNNYSFNDGMYLPGGVKTSTNTNYVELPGEIFVGQENLTISAWIKSNTNKGNYAAMFFGTAPNSDGFPENYWLFNPTSPDNYFKSVFTDSLNVKQPWTTEAGVFAGNTSGYKGIWTHYTTVLTEDSLTGYINGVKIGSASKSKLVSEFGTDLYAYLGRSNYQGDDTYAGTFQDVRVYGESFNDTQVKELYADAGTITESVAQILLQEAYKDLSLGNTNKVTDNIALPSAGTNGSVITWTSSNNKVITDSGEVNLSSDPQQVILTATIAIGSYSIEKEFTVHTVSLDELQDAILDKLKIDYILSPGNHLPSNIGKFNITWTSSNTSMVTNNGEVLGAADGIQDIVLTASIAFDSGTDEKIFNVKVMEADPDYILSYTRTASPILGHNMHLAYSEDGTSFEALNHNTAVLFPKADMTVGSDGQTKVLQNPYVFRMEDGSFGVVATRTLTSGQDSASDKHILVFTSQDLISYKEIGLLKLTEENTVINNPICEFDGATGQYSIYWTDNQGVTYENTVDSLSDLDSAAVSAPQLSSGYEVKTIATDIQNAAENNILAVTKEEGLKIFNRLSVIKNTNVTVKDGSGSEVSLDDGIVTPAGKSVDVSDYYFTAEYSDGQTKDFEVEWNAEGVNWNRPGEYAIIGTVDMTYHSFPFIAGRADPDIIYYNDKYYFIATDEDGQDELFIRVADTIEDLASARDYKILGTDNNEMKGCLWAPELHVVNGDLYVFFAASTNGSWNAVQSRVMKLKDPSADPTDANNWEASVRVTRKDGGALYSSGITLDMTYFEEGGNSYVMWAQRMISSSGNGGSDIWLAQIDPEDPSTLISDPVFICEPDYGWDRNNTVVDEGPYAIRNADGDLFVTISGGMVDYTYCVGILTLDDPDNILDTNSWTKGNYPILSTASVSGERGPGHNSYVEVDGEYINVYHALNNKDGGSRDAGLRKVYWSLDGTPVLDMTADRELLPEYQTFQINVEVTGDDVDDGLILHYDFADVEDTTVKDLSGNNNDGTIKGTGAQVQDNTLYLPGGAANSTSPYVELPTGMFDKQNTLSISIWLKNQTGRGNYAAMFFGANTTPPTQYWLLNPGANRSNVQRMKSVITNSLNASEPWTTEYGFTATNTGSQYGINGPETDDQWGLYTTVIKPGSITAYYNGQNVGTVSTSRYVSQFGDDLVAYIGKSTYSDMFYQGFVGDVKVSIDAWEDQTVENEYYRGLLKLAADKLTISENTVIDDIELPGEGLFNTAISWESSDQAHLKNDGTVIRPAKGEQDADITLTATLSINGYSVTKEFSITVLENDLAKDLQYYAERIELNTYYVTEDLELPDTIGTASIKWSSDSDYISSNGKVTRPAAGEGNQTVSINAELTSGDASYTKTFTLVVVEDYKALASYVQKGNTDLTDALFIAEQDDSPDGVWGYLKAFFTGNLSDSYTALNSGKAILYAKGGTQMGSPSIFRKADGTFGVIATENNSSSKILLYDSKDLTSFTNERTVELNDSEMIVKDPTVVYDGGTQAYKIYWVNDDAVSYVSVTKDFNSFITEEADYTKETIAGSLPGDALAAESAGIELSKAELDVITQKYARPYNTGIEEVDDMTVAIGETVELPEKVTASYSDGSSKNMAVEWDTSSLNTSKGGTYTVTGSVYQPEYPSPLVETSADPWAIYDEENDCYYFIASYPSYSSGTGYDRLVIRSAKTLEDLQDVYGNDEPKYEEVTIWDVDSDPTFGKYIWAPEIHKIGDTWSVLFTASTSKNNVWNLVPVIISCEGNAEGGLMNRDNWGEVKRVNKMAGDSSYQGISIDMTYFEVDGQGYYIWSEKPSSAVLYMATVDQSDPTQMTSRGMLLTAPDYAWEWNKGEGQYINEGPAVIMTEDKIFVCYSGSTVDYRYCVGVLTADLNSDLLNINSWTKNPYPLLTTSDCVYFGVDNKGEYEVGPGHNSFTIDAAGNPVIVYHARTQGEKLGAGDGGLFDPGRHARAKSVNYAADGSLILNMTRDEEINPEFAEFTVKITVLDETDPIETDSDQTDQTDPIETDTDQTDQTDPIETDSDQTDQTDPIETDTDQTDQTDPIETDSDQTDQTDPIETDSDQTDETDPNQSDSEQTDQTDPNQSDSEQTDQTDPNQSDSEQTDQSDSDSTDQTDPTGTDDTNQTDPTGTGSSTSGGKDSKDGKGKTSNKKTVKTGDTTAISIVLILLLISGTSLFIVNKKRRTQ